MAGNGNGLSAASFAAQGVARDPSDAQMEQIRDLLFGSVRAELLARFEALERRVATLERDLAAARQHDDDRRRAAFDQLAGGLAALSADVGRLGKT